ncbi:MAG: thiol-disulfide oxidoreductase DCC family protein [Propionibacteriaceae bacterium]
MDDASTTDPGADPVGPRLIFDGDCSFCTSTVQWLQRRLDRRDGTDPVVVPYQFSDLAALGTTPERAQQEVLWVAADGTLSGGAQAFAGWLVHRGGLFGVAGRALRLPFVRTLAAAVYRLVAANRSKMPGGTPACALPPPGMRPQH